MSIIRHYVDNEMGCPGVMIDDLRTRFGKWLLIIVKGLLLCAWDFILKEMFAGMVGNGVVEICLS